MFSHFQQDILAGILGLCCVDRVINGSALYLLKACDFFPADFTFSLDPQSKTFFGYQITFKITIVREFAHRRLPSNLLFQQIRTNYFLLNFTVYIKRKVLSWIL